MSDKDEADRIARQDAEDRAALDDAMIVALAVRGLSGDSILNLAGRIRAYGDQRARQAAEEMRTVLDDVLFWAGSICPQHDDRTDPNPCPLCGATLEHGPNDTCKAAENRVPPRLLAAIRASLPLPPDLGERK